MFKRKSKRKFGRETKQRKSLLRSLAAAFISHNRIETTQAKAKELRPYIEKMVTMGRVPSLASTKLLHSRLPKAAAAKLIKDIAPKFAQRAGGYTRIRNLAPRISDGARMAIIEFLS